MNTLIDTLYFSVRSRQLDVSYTKQEMMRTNCDFRLAAISLGFCIFVCHTDILQNAVSVRLAAALLGIRDENLCLSSLYLFPV